MRTPPGRAAVYPIEAGFAPPRTRGILSAERRLERSGSRLEALLNRAWTALRTKLVAPLLGTEHPPSYGARSVLVGLLAALSPLLGLQMALVAAWWWVVRRFRSEWDFNLVAALAWTWTTNVFSAPPLYYVYVMTGRLLLGRWERLTHYEGFTGGLQPLLPADAGIAVGSPTWGQILIERYAFALFLGALPWMLLLSGIGYYLTLRWLEVRHRRRHPGEPLPPR